MTADRETESLRNVGIAIIALGVVIAGLAYGRSLLVPIAAALFIWSVLEAMVHGFANLPLGSLTPSRPVAALITAVVVCFAFYLITSILLGQVDAITAVWPRYAARLETIVSDLTQWLGPERSAKVKQMMTEVDGSQWIPGLLLSTQSMVTGLLIVLAYVGFMFVESGYVGRKVAAMSRDEASARSTAALLTSVFANVQRYIWIKTIVSVATGGACYIVLRLLGIDFAETWALLIFVLNYIPNIGSILAVTFPALIALVQFDSLGPFLVLVASLTAIQLTIGSVIEPMFMGSSLNMSPLAIILSLAFWGTLWGIVGMFLSVPILLVILVVCAHVPSWRWLAILLSQDGQIATASADPADAQSMM